MTVCRASVPRVVSRSRKRPANSAARSATDPRRSAVMSSSSACPSLQSAPTVYPPRPRRPDTRPVGQADGRAGRTCSSPLWLCSSISAMPEVAPKLPSIWNGGCRSNMFGASRAGVTRSRRRSCARVPSSSRAQKLIFHASDQPVPSSPRSSSVRRAAANSSGVPRLVIWLLGCSPYRCETCRCAVRARSSRRATPGRCRASRSASAASRSRAASTRCRKSGVDVDQLAGLRARVEQVAQDLVVHRRPGADAGVRMVRELRGVRRVGDQEPEVRLFHEGVEEELRGALDRRVVRAQAREVAGEPVVVPDHDASQAPPVCHIPQRRRRRPTCHATRRCCGASPSRRRRTAPGPCARRRP